MVNVTHDCHNRRSQLRFSIGFAKRRDTNKFIDSAMDVLSFETELGRYQCDRVKIKLGVHGCHNTIL